MKIVLLGYMASGKSVIGKLLAEYLNYKFIDLDDFIEQKENLSIASIFSTKGEIYFRKVESLFLAELLKNNSNNMVLSLGGGTPCYGNNMEAIKKYSKSIYLKASIKTIYNRLLNESEKRPIVAQLPKEKLEEFIAKHLFERTCFYEQATYTIDTKDKGFNEIISEINQLI